MEGFSEINPAVLTLVSAFLPLVLAVVNRYNWPKEAKALADFIIVIVIGAGIAYADGVRDFNTFAVYCAAMYALSQAAYFGVYRPTGTADAVEKATG